MSEWYGGMGSSAEDSPVDSLDLEANFAYIRGERQKAGGSTAERGAGLSGLSPEQLAQAGQTLEEARRYFHGGLMPYMILCARFLLSSKQRFTKV